ncbi:unnamed protein product [Ranitomeya imitator]|uniref:Uncharacterized protein n=1 Tax=Ranitomeya imitator TaxID=111125 RepID=A0ABN9LCJ7_9NEOB|nr:unnamed protein product [Ranitomeya imitator]
MARIKGHNIRPFLKYYEPVSYNRDELFKDHLRSKRATNQEQIPIQLQIFGYNRKYELSLRRDKSVFTDDFKVLSDDTFVPMDISFVYSGKLKDESYDTALAQESALRNYATAPQSASHQQAPVHLNGQDIESLRPEGMGNPTITSLKRNSERPLLKIARQSIIISI